MTWKKRAAFGAAVAVAAAVAIVAASGSSSLSHLSNVASPNKKTEGVAAPNILSKELGEIAVAQGSAKLENGTADIPFYGYDGDGTMIPLPGTTTEATKTEPDKNTYLVFKHGLSG